MDDAERSELDSLRARVAELEEKDLLHDAGLESGPMADAVTHPTRPDILFSAIEKTRMPMIVTDPHQPDNPIIFVNRAFVKLAGYEASELLGRNCRFLQGEGTNPDHVKAVREAIAARETIAIDILNYRKDGSSFVNELYISPVFDRSGELRYFFGSQVDQTQYADDRRKLQQSEARYRSLFESIDAGFCVFDMIFDAAGKPVDYQFVEVNPAFQDQTDIADAVGKRMRDLAPEHEQHWFDIYGAVAKNRKSIRFEHHAAALGRYYEVHAYPVGSPSEYRVAALFTDVTPRKRAELDLKALTETLEEQVAERTDKLLIAEESLRQSQKMEAIGQLTGGVAHDFNNLLTIIRSAAEFLQRDGLSDERRQRYVGAIVETSERAARLTAQLLAFARRSPLKAELFDVGERMRAIGELIRPLVGDTITMSVDGCSPEPCLVNADPTQFETALVNLAVNARDAMDGKGEVLIAARCVDTIPPVRHHLHRAGRFVAISITDHGSGISPADMERVFEPFFTTKEAGKGTGLGLSQVFGFAKQSGGEIEVQSSPKGTIFTLYLPASRRSLGDMASDNVDTLALPEGACILVVEDNDEVGQFSTELLHDLGFKTLWVCDAEAALAKLKDTAGDFDLVFSDVMMPGMNGVDLGRKIRGLWPKLPVLLTSGYSEVIAEEGTHGFDLLRKPYSLDVLSEALRRAFAGQTEVAG